MKCPKCHSDNTDAARFCSNCATSLISAKTAPPALTKTLESPARVVASGTVFANRYEILGQLGAGGMGEVYRALDKNLGRYVAIKILPAAFAEDKERMARFEREAKLLAVLNHPNIAAIHGLEESEGRRFLVLELAEGETLQARLDRGALTVEEALETCRELAEGLEAAHEKGIVHRDLKPGNIMITPEGKVKILDFGLAKAYGAETSNVDIEKSPTITAQMTEPGVILGTAAYMSPEQARGRVADKRSDIWAFGGVLYECLTGKRAFHGETVSDTLALVLKGEPDWNALPANTPENIRTLLRRCLQKNPKNRLHDIADARLEIDEAGSPQEEESSLGRRFPLGWIVAVGAILFISGILIRPLIWKAHESASPAGLVASVIKLVPGHSLDGVRRDTEFYWPRHKAMAISSDGRFIVYCAVDDTAPGTKPRLFIRSLDGFEAVPIAGTEGGIAPFLSPDDRWVGFWADGKIKKVPAEGGMVQDICDAGINYGASWGRDDQIVFADLKAHSGLSSVAANGGKPEILTVPDTVRGDHRLPSHLPDGKGILFTIMQSVHRNSPRVAIFNTEARAWRDLIDDAADACYVPTGHLIYLRRAVLMAVPFSLSNQKITGPAVSVRSGIMQSLNNSASPTAAGQFSISASGCLIYAPGTIIPDMKNSLVWVDRKGNDKPAISKLDHFFVPRLSPDGHKIAYSTLGTNVAVGVYDMTRDVSYPLIPEASSWSPLWTPDGKNIIFGARRFDSTPSVFSRSVDGNAPVEDLIASISSGRSYSPASLSPDGSRLAIVEQSDILFMDLPSKKITPFRAAKYREMYPGYSPDGRWLVYASDEEGRFEVYVTSSSGSGGAIKVSSEGGREPGWARSGKEIFYRSLEGQWMWVADVEAGAKISVGKPRPLFFEGERFGAAEGVRAWDMSLDDQQFLMMKREVRPLLPVTELAFIQDWFEELTRLVPAHKK